MIKSFEIFDMESGNILVWKVQFKIIALIRQSLEMKLKALVVKNSVLHDFGFGKVSPAKQL